MALNYSDNFIFKIKKGNIEYDIQDAIAKEAIDIIQGDASQEGSIAKAKADAIAAAEGAQSTALTALSTKVGDIGESTVKDYVDTAVSGAQDSAADAIAALDATPSQSAGADGLALSLTQVDGVVTAISGSIAANTYDAHGAAADVQTALIGASTDLGDANTIYGAKTYAKGLVDKILGDDSASATLATLKQVIQELNAPENQQGITSTFIDTVKADLAGLTKDDGQGGTTHATVKEYVDNSIDALSDEIDDQNEVTAASLNELNDRINAITGSQGTIQTAINDLDAEVTSSDGTNVQVKVTEVDGKITAVNVTTDNTVNATNVSSAITTAIQGLDATVSQTAGADGLALSVTEVDGKLTAISGSIAANTYDAHGAAATAKSEVIGENTDASSANTIYGAKKYTDEAAAGAQTTLIGTSGDAASADTIYGAKAYADAAITGLDATVSQTGDASNGQLSLSVTEVDGKLTGIQGSIGAASTVTDHVLELAF